MLVLVLASQAVEGNDEPMSTLLVAQIRDGFTAAEELGELINQKNFLGSLTKLSQTVAPYLGIVGPFVAFGLAFADTESPELRAIKSLARRVDQGFDQIDTQFADIRREINWLPVRINFMAIEQKIRAVQNEFEHLSRVQASAYWAQKQIFTTNFESDYQNSGTKLYEAIMNQNYLYGSGVLQSVMEYTRYDRPKYQVFTLGLVKLLLMASKLEIAYYELKGYHENSQYYESIWNGRLDDVRRAIKRGDDRIVTESQEQWKRDVERYAIENPAAEMNNDNFARTLYDFLDRKFYWLDWIVVVYNPVSGYEKHRISWCRGLKKFRFHGRNFLVSNVPKTKPNIDLNAASSYIDGIPVLTTPANSWWDANVLSIHAQRSYDRLPSSVKSGCTYDVSGVIRRYADVAIYAPADRLADRQKPWVDEYTGQHTDGLRIFLFG